MTGKEPNKTKSEPQNDDAEKDEAKPQASEPSRSAATDPSRDDKAPAGDDAGVLKDYSERKAQEPKSAHYPPSEGDDADADRDDENATVRRGL